nr:PHD finger protein ALFIN-LIKE 2-like [Ipomoea batatas]
MASFPPNPRSVEDIFKNFAARRSAVLYALTRDVDDFFSQCDPGFVVVSFDNLCLYGHPDERWEVTLPAEDVPPEIPEPVLGINFARDGMEKRDWLSLVAMHTDSWLLAVAFYFGAQLNRNERNRLFSMINELPTIYEIASERKPSRERPIVNVGNKSMTNAKCSIDEFSNTPPVTTPPASPPPSRPPPDPASRLPFPPSPPPPTPSLSPSAAPKPSSLASPAPAPTLINPKKSPAPSPSTFS